MNKNGVPVGSVYTAKDVFQSEQVKSRKLLVDIEDPEVGKYQFTRGPVMLSESPEIETDPAPDLGQHTHEILSSLLKYDEEKISDLVDSKCVTINS